MGRVMRPSLWRVAAMVRGSARLLPRFGQEGKPMPSGLQSAALAMAPTKARRRAGSRWNTRWMPIAMQGMRVAAWNGAECC